MIARGTRAIAWEALLLLLRVQRRFASRRCCCRYVRLILLARDCGRYLPCKRWDNFYDSSKADEYKFTLSTTGANNNLVGGDTPKYQCYWRYADGNSVPNTSKENIHTHSSSTKGVQIGFLFRCWLGKFISSIVAGVPDNHRFTTVDYVKETVFRKYDTNPRDGKLSYMNYTTPF